MNDALQGSCGRVRTLWLVWLAAAVLAGATRLAASADDRVAAFEEANRLYEGGKFVEACQAYERLLGTGVCSAALLFNLGNAYFKSGQVGRAVVQYRRATLLDPRDPDIRANLQFVRQSVYGASTIRPAWWRRAAAWLSLNEWAAMATIGFWGVLLLLALGQWRPALRKPLFGLVVAVGTALWIALLGLGVLFQSVFREPVAIVVRPEVVVRYGPLEESQVYYQAHDGAELAVLDTQGQWLQVSDPARRLGWLKRSDVVLFP